MKVGLPVSLFIAGLCFGSAAMADQILFPSSEGGPPNNLILTLQNGTSYTFDTSQGEFNSPWLNQGWWEATTGLHFPTNQNFIVGTQVGYTYNDFFTFDIGGVVAADLVNNPVVSATLEIPFIGTSGFGYPFTYYLFDVSTPAATLNNTSGPSPSIFDDLGSGTMYGEVSLTADPTTPFDIALNADAVSAINGALIPGALVYFSIGGTLSPVSVPEPGTLALLGLGLATLATSPRRKHKLSAALPGSLNGRFGRPLACWWFPGNGRYPLI